MGDFILKLDPDDKVTYVGKKLGEEPVLATLKVTNPTKDRQVCKVKCTSNEMFRIRPPVFALKPEEEVTVKLTFNAGKTVPDSGKHYYAVYYIKGTDESKAPRACWKDHKGDPDGTKRLKVYFKKDDEEEKKDEKKDEKDEKKEGDGKKSEGEKKDDEKKEGEEKKEGDEKKEEGEKEEKKEDEKKDDDKKDEKKEEDKGDEKKEEGEKKEDEKKDDDKKEDGENKDDEKKEDDKEDDKKDDDKKE